MATTFLTKIFGSRNDRLLKTYRKTITQINAMEPQYEKLDDAQLRAKTEEFKTRFTAGETLDDILPGAFAVVREGSKRAMKMRHFDVQLLGGMSLHNGKISEMGTGEGKTLTSTLPVYLNALTGKGVHVVTVNDYLASRDARWMGKLYEFLGMTVGVNLPTMSREEKQAAYQCDIGLLLGDLVTLGRTSCKVVRKFADGYAVEFFTAIAAEALDDNISL